MKKGDGKTVVSQSPIDTSRTPEEYDKLMKWFKVGDQTSYYTCLRFNPLSTGLMVFLVVLFVIGFTATEESQDWSNTAMKDSVRWINQVFTWFYVASQNVWLVFLAYIGVSKYGNIRLGKQNEKPEFSDMTWFVMLFACGTGVGFFFYGCSEPLGHYNSVNRYTHKTELERIQDGMNLTMFHWGIHGWIVYAIVALNISIVSYRWGLPMTIRSCFYPLLGDRVFGIIGDCIDTLSSITTLFGVCTSLGLGAKSLNAGFNRLSCDVDINKNNQTYIIIFITAVAMCSVLTGLRKGIRYLSWVCFILGNTLAFSVLFLDETWYILDVMTQTVGYYFQHIIELGFWCDAFVRSGENGGLGILDGTMTNPGLVAGTTTVVPGSVSSDKWMEWWTIFYWGWWISWSPFVGMFIAKISRGRSLRSFIFGTMAAPLGYSFFWFSVFGGAAIRMDRRAKAAGTLCGAAPSCGSDYDANNLMRLSCSTGERNIYDVIGQPEYGIGEGSFLICICLVSLFLYFVTSSDSGSLVIDCMLSNGDLEPPAAQRVFWSWAEAACAISLLRAPGATGSLRAIQNMSIIMGLPYTVVICFMCTATWRALLHEFGELKGRAFKLDYLNPFFSLCGLKSAALGTIAPSHIWYQTALLMKKKNVLDPVQWSLLKIQIVAVLLTCFDVAFWLLMFVCWGEDSPKAKGMWVLAWLCYLTISVAFFFLRYEIRNKFGVLGNVWEDMFGALCVPLCAAQVHDNMVAEEVTRALHTGGGEMKTFSAVEDQTDTEGAL